MLKSVTLGLVGVTVIATAVLSFARSGTADSISSEKAYAAQLASQIQRENNEISELNEQWDQAQIKLQQINSQIATNTAAVDKAEHSVNSDLSSLRNEAVVEYMSGGSTSGIAEMFAGSGTTQSDAQEYQNLEGGDVQSMIDALHVNEQTLSVQRGQLNSAKSQQRSLVAKLASQKTQAQQVEQQLQSTLSQVRGRIATLVHQAQVAAEEAQQRAFEKKVQEERAAALAAQEQAEAEAAAQAAAQQAVQQQQTTPTTTTVTTGAAPSGNDAQGEEAVHAAETQLGVPYVWGGSTPGVGFDCSGLTMWSWEQAGVSLPHSAADQMQVTTPVALADLQPGDLLFYYDSPGYVGHVTMYVGPGTMIQAEETGTNVMYTSIWYQNLAGAGQP